MKKLDFGKISVPLDEYASQGNAVLGIRGSGKSYTATYVAERMLDAGLPIVAFDPIGIWRFLRVPAAGGSGYKVVVAGGEHGDIPLPAHGAAEIMRAAMRDGVSIVFDLYDINLSKGDWRRVVESAIKVLLYENKAHGLRHIFLEEAAEFCPQRIQPDQGSVYSAIERLARMGGNAQLGYTLINQRAEEVNKAVLELCDLLVLHRQKGRNSLIALSKWLDVAQVRGEIAEKVPALENGEAYIWPTGDAQPVKTKIPAKRTFHPDRKAMQKASAAETKSADVSAFVATMRASLQQLTKEADENDLKKLKARIRELERRPGKAAPERVVEVPVLKDGQLARTEKIAARMQEYGDKLLAEAAVLRRTISPAAAPRAAMVQQIVVPRAPVPRASITNPEFAALASAQRKILGALAFLEQVGISPADRTQASLFADLSPTAGHTQNMYGGLRSAGYIEYPHNGAVVLTASGRALADPGKIPQTAEQMQAILLAKVATAQRKLLTVLIGAYPKAMDRRECSEQAGLSPEAGHTQNMYGGLRSLGLIDYPSPGQVVALPVLFLQ